MTYTNPANPNRPMEPASIVQALDDAAISGPLDRHAWDYDTNVAEVVVDHEARTITFKVKSHRPAIGVPSELRDVVRQKAKDATLRSYPDADDPTTHAAWMKMTGADVALDSARDWLLQRLDLEMRAVPHALLGGLHRAIEIIEQSFGGETDGTE